MKEQKKKDKKLKKQATEKIPDEDALPSLKADYLPPVMGRKGTFQMVPDFL